MALEVLHITSHDSRGGASRAAVRLHFSLLNIGIKSKMFVQHKSSNAPTILTENNFFVRKINRIFSFIDTLPARILQKNINNYSPSIIGSIGLVKKINKLNPDIVHLHWVCNAMLSIEDIAKIDPPIIWTLHDNWAFSGGCHNMQTCPNHNHNTHNCETAFNSIFKRKKKAYLKKQDLAIVSPSKWLYKLASMSELLNDKKNFTIPNPLDIEAFRPLDMKHARKIWGLPKDKKIILCGALNISSDSNKGLAFLKEAWNQLNDPFYELVIFGNDKISKNNLGFKGRVRFVGRIQSEKDLNTLYSAADVMIVPSKQENFSNVILESLSSGTPVIAFDVGGNKDLILHNKNGYLVKPYDIKGLITSINLTLSNSNIQNMRNYARSRVEDLFHPDRVAKSYEVIYKNLLNQLSHK